ncbi:MAG: HlyD family secretion protein [Pirellulales bacterium]
MKVVLPIVAVGLMVFAFWSVFSQQASKKAAAPPAEPPHSPFGATVAGAGIVEARTENIAVGSPASGVVVEVFVDVGQHVKQGDPLFRIDDRTQQAELKLRQAAVAAAQAEVERLANFPRPEQIPVSQAGVDSAKAELAEQQDQLRRIRPLVEKGVSTDSDLVRLQQAVMKASAMLEKAEAELKLLKAGSWKYELTVAQAAVAQAQAQVDQVQAEIDQLDVRALTDAQVLQLNVRPGEWVGGSFEQPLILLGDIERLHARVDIDEYDIPRFQTDAPAKAMIRGFADQEFALKFVRLEPYVIPKQNLTGRNTERVDTRVLQAIYAIETKGRRLFVGQQLDVFIEAKEEKGGKRKAEGESLKAGG